MLALCRQILRSPVLARKPLAALQFAATAACLLTGLPSAWAADVYFPATTAYDRRNYDPFDQTAAQTAAATPPSEVRLAEFGHAADYGDVQLSSEVRLLGSDPFGHSAPIALPPIAPAAFQAAPSTAPESLPTPDGASAQGVPSREPGADWTPKPLDELTTNTVLPGGVLPRDYWSERSTDGQGFFDPCGATRGWSVNNFNWVASCLCSNPLYFEEVNLERYGYGCGCYGSCCSTCVQSATSAAHFFGNVVALPYKMGVDCPCECDYTLGHYRPGSCPPRRWHCCSRCSALGTLTAGGVATGLIFLIP
ncbi:MAG: hypothetical protein AB7G28_06005 [Pirellulales bacterium]